MIHVHGYLGEISPAVKELAARCALVLGGSRHLENLDIPEEKRVVLGPLPPALERLAELPADRDALVLASGDPGFHGILRALRLAGHEVTVEPAVTSAAAAFAAVKLPWDDALIVSAHDGSLTEAIRVARDHRKVAVLTRYQEGIALLAEELADLDRTWVLAERLGEEDEQVRILTTSEARALTTVKEPNVVLILDGHPDDPALIDREAATKADSAAEPSHSDVVDLLALDVHGWPHDGDALGVARALMNAEPVLLEKEHPWPLPLMPKSAGVDVADPVARILVTDREISDLGSLPTVVLHPDSLVIGIDCSTGVSKEALRSLLAETLAQQQLSLASVRAVTTVEGATGELGLLDLVRELGLQLIDYTPEELREQGGDRDIAEAAVRTYGAGIVVAGRSNGEASCAIGRMPVRGCLRIIGLGPGSRDLLTPRAVNAVRQSSYIVGYGPYVRQIRDLARPGTRFRVSKMGTELERTAAAIQAARDGQNVALVSSGDAGIYAMASPVLQQGTDGIDVEVVPGITASLAVSALLGAPLGHDHITISLSHLHTEWEVIERRLHAAADGDLVTVLYNPRSRTRVRQLPRALEIIGAKRRPDTPVAVIQHAERQREKIRMSTLADFNPEWVNMSSLVVIGSTTTSYVTTGSGEHRMVTPRDYKWMTATSPETKDKS